MGFESENFNLILGIDGSIQYPHILIHASQENFNQFIFGKYISTILTDIKTNPVPNGNNDTNIPSRIIFVCIKLLMILLYLQ